MQPGIAFPRALQGETLDFSEPQPNRCWLLESHQKQAFMLSSLIFLPFSPALPLSHSCAFSSLLCLPLYPALTPFISVFLFCSHFFFFFPPPHGSLPPCTRRGKRLAVLNLEVVRALRPRLALGSRFSRFSLGFLPPRVPILRPVGSFKRSTMVRKQEETKLGCTGEERGRGCFNCRLAVISQSPSTVLHFFLFWQNLLSLQPPHTPPFLPSPYHSFLCFTPPTPPDSFPPPPPACLLTQTLNLLEPRDPVCYVNQLKRRHTCERAHAQNVHTDSYGPLCRLQTHTCTCAHSQRAIWSKLGLAAFLAGVQLSTIAHKLMQCLQELPVTTKSKAFPSERRTVGGLRRYAVAAMFLRIPLYPFPGLNAAICVSAASPPFVLVKLQLAAAWLLSIARQNGSGPTAVR